MMSKEHLRKQLIEQLGFTKPIIVDYLQSSRTQGLIWKEPVNVLHMISDTNELPNNANVGDAYVVNNWEGYNDGDIVEFNGNAWVTIVQNIEGKPPIKTRVCVDSNMTTGSFLNHNGCIATYTENGWTFEVAEYGYSLLVCGCSSVYEYRSFVFDVNTNYNVQWIPFT